MKTILIPLALTALAALPGAQNTYHVPADFSAIQTAIDAAADGDTILVAPGTYDEWDIRTNGKKVVIRSTGGAAVTTIDGNDNNRVFFFNGNETDETVLDGFTIVDGYAPHGGGTIGDGGGGILVVNGFPTIKNCVITSCRADYGQGGPNRGGHGGGLYIVGGGPLVENCRITSNYAGTGGTGNKGADGSDGGLFTSPTAGKPGGTGGTGGHGGGIYVENASPTIVNCFIAYNHAGRGGTGGRGGNGGDGWAGGTGAAGGRGGNGGRGGEGGAIYVASGSPTIVNSTLITDFRGDGGSGGQGGNGGSSGGAHGAPGSPGPSGVVGGIAAGFATEFFNSISWSHTGTPLTGPNAQYCNLSVAHGGAGNISVWPALSGHELTAGSPCIDAGNGALVPAAALTDLDGNPRMFDDPFTANSGAGDPVDIGCSELVGAYAIPYGCGNRPGSLLLESGEPVPGATLTFRMPFNRNRLGERAALIVGVAPDPSACGTKVAGGYLQVDLAQSHSILLGPATGARRVDLVLPPDPAMVGSSWFVQGLSIAPQLAFGGSTATASSVWKLHESMQLVVGP